MDILGDSLIDGAIVILTLVTVDQGVKFFVKEKSIRIFTNSRRTLLLLVGLLGSAAGANFIERWLTEKAQIYFIQLVFILLIWLGVWAIDTRFMKE